MEGSSIAIARSADEIVISYVKTNKTPDAVPAQISGMCPSPKTLPNFVSTTQTRPRTPQKNGSPRLTVHQLTVNVKDKEWFTPAEVPVMVSVPDCVPVFPPPLLLPELLPPQPFTHATIRSTRAGTRHHLDRFALTADAIRIRATANAARSVNTKCANCRMFGGFVSSDPIKAAAVVTVTVMNCEAEVPFTVTALGKTEHADLASTSPQLSVTVPLNPLIGVICRL